MKKSDPKVDLIFQLLKTSKRGPLVCVTHLEVGMSCVMNQKYDFCGFKKHLPPVSQRL